MKDFQKLIAISFFCNVMLQGCGNSNWTTSCDQSESIMHQHNYKDVLPSSQALNPIEVSPHIADIHQRAEENLPTSPAESWLSTSRADVATEAAASSSESLLAHSYVAASSSAGSSLLPPSVRALNIPCSTNAISTKKAPFLSTASTSLIASSQIAKMTTSCKASGHGPFRLLGNKEITFDQVHGKWKAIVKDNFLMREETLPVVCRGDVLAILSDLQGARAVDVASRIHLLAPNQVSRCVYVGALGLRGGVRCVYVGELEPRKEVAENNSKRYTSFLNKVKIIQDYLQDTREQEQDLGGIATIGLEKSIRDQWQELSEYTFGLFRDILEDLYKMGEELLKPNRDITIDDYLSWLLELRRNYLWKRNKDIYDSMGFHENESGVFTISTSPFPLNIIPTDEHVLALFLSPETPSSMKELNMHVSKESIFYFEMINLLIRELFSVCEISELSNRTIELIRRSKKLWPILLGETEELGHPDGCTYFGRIAEIIKTAQAAIIEKYPPEEKDPQKEAAIKQALEKQAALKQAAVERARRKAAKKITKGIKTKARKILEYEEETSTKEQKLEAETTLDAVNNHKLLLKEIINKENQQEALYWYQYALRSNINPGEALVKTIYASQLYRWLDKKFTYILDKKSIEQDFIFEQLEGGGVVSAYDMPAVCRSNFIARGCFTAKGRENYKLFETALNEIPPFLTRTEEKGDGEKPVEGSFATAHPHGSTAEVASEGMAEGVTSEKREKDSELDLVSAFSELGTDLLSTSTPQAFLQETIDACPPEEVLNSVATLTEPSQEDNDKEIRTNPLDDSHKKILKNLFSSDDWGQVTYDEYKLVWESLGGKISSTTGSHWTLLKGANDEHLGMIVNPHGKNKTHGKRTIESLKVYIRELLAMQNFAIEDDGIVYGRTDN